MLPRCITVAKLSVALDDRLAEQVRAAAQAQGLSVSAWLSRAAARALRVEQGLAAVREWEADAGALTAAERQAAEALLLGQSARARAC